MEKWEDRFDEKFTEMQRWLEIEGIFYNPNKELKQFISELLKEKDARIIELEKSVKFRDDGIYDLKRKAMEDSISIVKKAEKIYDLESEITSLKQQLKDDRVNVCNDILIKATANYRSEVLGKIDVEELKQIIERIKNEKGE